VAVRTPERTVIEAVIDAADQGLYAAKRRGRNRVVVFDNVTARDTMPEAPEAVRLAEGLAVAASIRESVHTLHCSQVADLAARTAAAMALAPDAVLRCRLGGWLHDVGKLALSDDVLRAAASGTLDADQRETFRAHAEVGAAIIAGLPSLTGAADGVRHHHERFDGSGYPHGLRGVAIPIEARIIAAADTYSAITAGRPHQPPLDHDAAIEQLRTVAGYSLDPQVVAAITTVISEPTRSADLHTRDDATS
jgi:HD-GYP domain-containing protein (c-di-GMP phosphodiesterase class II)